MSVSHAPPRHLYGQLLGEPLTHAAWRIHALLLLLLPIMAWQVIVPAHQEPNFGIKLADGQLVIRDLAAHIRFARAFWAEGGDYSVASHIQITNAWCGQDVNRALPFGYSPTMLWLLAPFCVLTTKWGFVIWTLINGGAVWWMAQRRRSVCLIGALALVSPLTMISMALGQTSLLTAAGIIFLMLRHRRADLEATERWSWLLVCEVVVLWALTAKPPLAIAAAAANSGTACAASCASRLRCPTRSGSMTMLGRVRSSNQLRATPAALNRTNATSAAANPTRDRSGASASCLQSDIPTEYAAWRDPEAAGGLARSAGRASS